jgi:hypothetical protein
MTGTRLEVTQQSSVGGGSVCTAASRLHVCTAASHVRTGTAPQAAASAASASTAFTTPAVAPAGGLDGAFAAAWIGVPGREGKV